MAEAVKYNRGQIMKMAGELGMALAQSEEILAYRQAEKEMAQDSEACRLTRIFKNAHKALAQKEANPETSPKTKEELMASLEQADGEMKAHPLVAEYYRAGGAFNQLVYQINQLLKFYSMEPEEDAQFSQSGGCSSCNGSCSHAGGV